MSHEYEQIDHNIVKNLKVFLVNLDYRTPHMHKELEICLLLDGAVTVTFGNESRRFEKEDYFVLNPFQVHELRADSTATILSIQIQSSFCKNYYPAIRYTVFGFDNFMDRIAKEKRAEFSATAHSLAYHYFLMEDGFELICVSEVNKLLYELLCSYPFIRESENGQKQKRARQERMQRILDYIDQHYTERLYLSELAQREQLSLTYLSHFFKDSLQMSFQDYLMSLRCERARQLLLLTDLNLLDISMDCGFSDIKYFHHGFRRQYGCTPREFRQSFDRSSLQKQQQSILSTQEFLSPQASLILLDGLK